MIQFLKNLIRNPFRAFLNIGITPELDFLNRKKIEVINILMFITLPLLIYFVVTNSLRGRYLLVAFDVFTLALSISILVLHSFRKYNASRFVISLGFLFCFTLQAIFYKNGAEYFIFANLVATLILYNDRGSIFIMAISNCIAIIFIKYIEGTGFLYETVPAVKVLFNTGLGVSLATISLLYFLSHGYNHAKEIEKKNDELAILNKTKEKLFSIIAHDLRSPVALLKGSLGLVTKETISKEEFVKLTDQIGMQINYMQSNLEELLLWSQSQMSGIIANPKMVSLRDITEEVIALLKNQSESKQIAIIDLIQMHTIWIDPDHLKLVLRNIISNAIKFSYPGNKVEISSNQSIDNVNISIRDFGMGMLQQEIDELFSESIHTTKGTAQEKGTGLGLKLCKEFLSKSNSTLHIQSIKGKGSTFIITIPVKK